MTDEQRADLEAAQLEFLQAVSEAGLKQLRVCGPGGARWQDDPQAVRAVAALIRNLHHEDRHA